MTITDNTRQLKRTSLLDQLWEFHDKKGYLWDEDVDSLAEKLGISSIELEGVVSFYHFFHRKPTGKFTIYLNNSIVSEIKGFRRVKEALEKATGARFGSVDPTGTFGLFETSCIGLSDQEPAALINFHPFTNLTPGKVDRIINALNAGRSVEDICDEIQDNIRQMPPEKKRVFFRPFEQGAAISKLQEMTPGEVIGMIKESHLSGMGGAFFPTGIKWESCSKQPASPKYVICNADEGEPGTFKDRVLMNRLPGLLIEGMIVAGYAIGAKEGFIYLRAEYRYLQQKLEDAIEAYRQKGRLGKGIPAKQPFDFDLKVQLGAGAYVCGEETALIESMEGKRGEPRNKQFFPVERGFLDKPTVVNNVETLCAAARILEMGLENFTALGTPMSKGTKLMSVSGDCKYPGIYEVEWGITLGELLEICGADDPYFIQISGPSGECVPERERYRRLCMEDLLCGGSVMIFNSERDILKILKNYSNFFKEESCGLCTPCRAGNLILGKKIDKLALGLGNEKDLEELQAWSRILQTTSRCGLGKTSPNSLIKALEKFPEYFDPIVKCAPDCINKGFDLERALQLHKDIHQRAEEK
jgi:[NiFe] hydrogenase diaphorase moiety large subunit